jgi:hemerythrin-like metal-binding protein
MMELIIWRDTFETGNPRIDAQHKNLVKLINNLFNTLGLKTPEKKLKEIIMELYNYTINHFSLEESMMREFGYSNYHAHKQEHSDFVNKLNDFKSKFLSGEAKLNINMLNFLKDWLLNHILEVDKKTFLEIQKK